MWWRYRSLSEAVKIIALDPSSTCVGYAVLTGLQPSDLVDGGLITAKPASLPPVARLRQFAADLELLLREHADAGLVAIEIPSGHVNHGRNRGSGAGLTVYGMAVGYVLAHVEAAMVACMGKETILCTAKETDWTGSQRKTTRATLIAATYRGRYDRRSDPGLDVADAIGLARWVLLNKKRVLG